MQNNLLMAANNHRVKRFIFLGSSCIYPKVTKTPINKNQLLTGKLEKTNEAYALAKICKNFQTPFISFKYISDGADSNSADDWNENISSGYKKFYEIVVKGILK